MEGAGMMETNTLRELLTDWKVELLSEVREIVRDEVRREIATLKQNMATKEDVALIHKKLDALAAQVADNTEQEVKLHDVMGRVAQLEIDVSLLKKAVANQ